MSLFLIILIYIPQHAAEINKIITKIITLTISFRRFTVFVSYYRVHLDGSLSQAIHKEYAVVTVSFVYRI